MYPFRIRNLFPALALTLAVLIHCGAPASAATPTANAELTIDTTLSKVVWHARKVVGDQHRGTVAVKSGSVSLGPDGKPTAAQITIDMRSIENEDVTNERWNAKLVKHLKSDDFFAVSKHPVATLVVTEIREGAKESGYTHTLDGNLTIRGETRPTSFPAKIVLGDGAATATGRLTVDRTEFGVRYGSGKFFQNLGNRVIADNFTLEFEIHAGGDASRAAATSRGRVRRMQRSKASATAQ